METNYQMTKKRRKKYKKPHIHNQILKRIQLTERFFDSLK